MASDLIRDVNCTRERVPLDWAMTQNNLGHALRTLGERESGTAQMEEAVAAPEAVLIFVTSPVSPTAHYRAVSTLQQVRTLLGKRRRAPE